MPVSWLITAAFVSGWFLRFQSVNRLNRLNASEATFGILQKAASMILLNIRYAEIVEHDDLRSQITSEKLETFYL